ncbi:polyprenol monophosphomannose synthase [Candidatus Kuenenbacteria bacterium]|nr:polyprenol monophosphomannose synthase [Candidatus Kuenenbacteria bacterium]
MKNFIILPTYNEKENLAELVMEIFGQGINDLSILIIDDNSPDGTGVLADELSQKYPVFVIHRRGKLGLGSAYREGFDYCLDKGAEYIFEMDADFSHDPKDLPRLLSAAKDGADLVIGSRKIKGGQIIGWNWERHLYSNGAMFFARFLLNLKTRDITAGFRCFCTNALKKIDYSKIKSNGYAFQIEMVYHLEKAGLKIVEAPVTFIDRQKGQSKLGQKDIREFFKTILNLKINRKAFLLFIKSISRHKTT